MICKECQFSIHRLDNHGSFYYCLKCNRTYDYDGQMETQKDTPLEAVVQVEQTGKS